MKVLLASHRAEILGGGEESLLELTRALGAAGHERILACPGDGEVAARARAAGAEIWRLSMPRLGGPRVLAWPVSVLALARRLRRAGVEVVHANTSRAMAYCAPAARLAGLPVIWHVRVSDPDPRLDPILGSLADRIVVISDAVAARFAAARPGLRRRVRRVHNGVDTARFHPARSGAGVRRELGIEPSAPVVGILGRLEPAKGHRVFLEAAAGLARQFPHCRFLVVGRGPLEGDLVATCRALGLLPGRQVVFAGSRADAAPVVAALDVLVLASEREHFGRVLIEAMAGGRPVVATAAGGVPEIVVDGETGLLVPPGDPEAMADAIGRVLADAALAGRLGKAGRRRAEACFSLEEHARAIEAVYREVVA